MGRGGKVVIYIYAGFRNLLVQTGFCALTECTNRQFLAIAY